MLLGTEGEKEIDEVSDGVSVGSVAWEESTMVDSRGRHEHFSLNILPPHLQHLNQRQPSSFFALCLSWNDRLYASRILAKTFLD